jgi:hypothetical protein
LLQVDDACSVTVTNSSLTGLYAAVVVFHQLQTETFNEVKLVLNLAGASHHTLSIVFNTEYHIQYSLVPAVNPIAQAVLVK